MFKAKNKINKKEADEVEKMQKKQKKKKNNKQLRVQQVFPLTKYVYLVKPKRGNYFYFI